MLLLSFSTVSAQEKKDSLYTKIEEFSDKRKVTKFLHRFIFRREADSASISSAIKKNTENNYKGKFIRNIKIETIDPFGYTKEQRQEDSKWYDRIAEKVHIDSRKSTVKNYLMFKKGDEYDAQKIYESERLLRTKPFVNRVDIRVIDSTSTKDSVDVRVRVLDSWSLKPQLSFSGSKIGLGILEQNFMGLGDEVNLYYTRNFKEKQDHVFGSYTANNLFGSFIDATILGERDFVNNERIGFSAARGFFSPLTRWAGGFAFEYFKRKVALPLENTYPFPAVQIKVYRQDLWGGYQFPLKREDDGRISKNIAVLGRFQNYQYKDSPEVDNNSFFRTSNSILASAVYTDRQYRVHKNVFQYELPEDIPFGKSLGLTSGIVIEGKEIVPYGGISASLGEFTDWGFFNVKAQYGRFFHDEKQNRDEFRIDGTYFTPLQNWKFARVRHFFSPTLAIGNQHYNYSYKDRINLSAADEFPMFSGDFIGTKKLILRYQMQFFINKTWKNFHFNPYLTTAFGWLSQNGNSLFSAPTQTKVGVGMLIYNPFLVFNRIQVSFMYYPKLPLDNKPGFDFNQYRSDYFPISSFSTDVPHFVNFGN